MSSFDSFCACEALEGRTFLAAGDLVTSFGVGGYAIPLASDSPGGEPVAHMLLTSGASRGDKSVLLQGPAGITGAVPFALQRCTSAGAPDATFAQGGMAGGFAIANAEWGDFKTTQALATDVFGRVLVGETTDPRFQVYRYRTDGLLDTSFAGNGVRIVARKTQQASDGSISLVPGGITALAIQSKVSTLVGAWQGNQVEVWRLDVNGRFDRTFGRKGQAIFATNGNLRIKQVIPQRDGKILLLQQSPGKVSVRRLNANGQLDTTFGTNGRFLAKDSGSYWHMAMRPDGSIVLSGLNPAGGGDTDHAVVLCLDSSGKLETSFGKAGRIAYAVKGKEFDPTGLAVQSDGKLILSGWENRMGSSTSVLTALRFDAAGRLDKTFGRSGRVSTTVTANGWEHAADVQVRKDGNILLAASDGLRTNLVLLKGK